MTALVTEQSMTDKGCTLRLTIIGTIAAVLGTAAVLLCAHYQGVLTPKFIFQTTTCVVVRCLPSSICFVAVDHPNVAWAANTMGGCQQYPVGSELTCYQNNKRVSLVDVRFQSWLAFLLPIISGTLVILIPWALYFWNKCRSQNLHTTHTNHVLLHDNL